MKHEPGIFEERDRKAEAAAIVRARADAAAGRVHDHEIVKEWLMTRGQLGRPSFRERLAIRNGQR